MELFFPFVIFCFFCSTESEKSDENTVKEDIYSRELWSKLTERWEQLNLANQDPWESEFKQFVASVQVRYFQSSLHNILIDNN